MLDVEEGGTEFLPGGATRSVMNCNWKFPADNFVGDIYHALWTHLGGAEPTLAAIAARLGGSKQTLYGYFKSKEALFAEAMVIAMEERGHETSKMLERNPADIRKALQAFGEAYLDFISSPELIQNSRIAIGAAGSGDLGAQLYELRPRRFWEGVSAYLGNRMEQGQLCAPSAEIAAIHLQGLLEAGCGEALLFGASPTLKKKETVEAAVAAYLKAYGT